MRVMAQDHDWRWLGRGAWRIRSRAKPVRDKRAWLQSPDRVTRLADEMMAEAEVLVARDPLKAAVLFRNGLIIGFLARRLIRIKNLHRMTIGQNLLPRHDGYVVTFSVKETKTHRPLEFSWPAELVAHLEKYLAIYRPILVAGGKRRRPPSNRLWMPQIGTPVGEQTIRHHVELHTKKAFGIAVNPHAIRDCAATAIAIAAPEEALIIGPVLGHTDERTSERHYNQARGLHASRRYHSTFAKLRKTARSRHRNLAAERDKASLSSGIPCD